MIDKLKQLIVESDEIRFHANKLSDEAAETIAKAKDKDVSEDVYKTLAEEMIKDTERRLLEVGEKLSHALRTFDESVREFDCQRNYYEGCLYTLKQVQGML